jgi:cyclic lactone autoinducer peptide
MFAALALMVTASVENSVCMWIIHQEPLPSEAKKLRKF